MNNFLTCVLIDYNSGFTRYRFHESKLFPNWSKNGCMAMPRSSALKLDLSLARFICLLDSDELEIPDNTSSMLM